MPARKQRLRARSEKRADPDRRAVEDDVRRAVFARDGGCLLRSTLFPKWGRCFGPLTPHHLFKSGQGGEYDEDNLVCLCAHHNDMVEDRPLEARELGLVVLPGRIDHAEAAARRAFWLAP